MRNMVDGRDWLYRSEERAKCDNVSFRGTKRAGIVESQLGRRDGPCEYVRPFRLPLRVPYGIDFISLHTIFNDICPAIDERLLALAALMNDHAA